MSPLLLSAPASGPEKELSEHQWTEEPAKGTGDLPSTAAKVPCRELQRAY